MPSALFSPIRLADLELANRIVVSPMCQYSAIDGVAGDWHLVHLGRFALGGAARSQRSVEFPGSPAKYICVINRSAPESTRKWMCGGRKSP